MKEKIDAINDPGVREEQYGTVIQMARRSEQLKGIANSLDAHAIGDMANLPSAQEIRQVQRYAQQLRIIASELKAAGK